MADTRQQGCIKGNTATTGQSCEHLVGARMAPAQIFRTGMQCQATQQSQRKLLNRANQACADGMADHENSGQAYTQATQPNHPVCFQGVDQPGFKGKLPGLRRRCRSSLGRIFFRNNLRFCLCRINGRSRRRLLGCQVCRCLRKFSESIPALEGGKLLPESCDFTAQRFNTGGVPVTLAKRQKAQQRTDRHQQGSAGHKDNENEFQTTIPCLLKKSGLNPARLRHQAIHHGNRNIPENCL